MSITHHHPIFDNFEPWKGRVEEGFLVDLLGVKTRKSFFNLLPEQSTSAGIVSAELPAIDEEYFEWIDLLKAVRSAHETFTMIELGGGWGRWLVRAAFAAKELRCKLIGVEAEPTHFAWMKQHFLDNGLDPREHVLIEAAISDSEGTAWFYTGSADTWYGQSIFSPVTWRDRVKLLLSGKREKKINDHTVKIMKTKSLSSILKVEKIVDLIDLDVQGSEFIVLRAARRELAAKVKKVHIGTHSSEIESSLRQLFNEMKWSKINDFPCQSESETAYGVVKFQDGVQTWLNPRLRDDGDA